MPVEEKSSEAKEAPLSARFIRNARKKTHESPFFARTALRCVQKTRIFTRF